MGASRRSERFYVARKVYSREWKIAFTASAIGLWPTPNNQIGGSRRRSVRARRESALRGRSARAHSLAAAVWNFARRNCFSLK